jgi:hypothetical protein
MTQRDRIGITQRDKTCPVAVASGRDKPCKGLSRPFRLDSQDSLLEVASGYARPAHRPRYVLTLEAQPDPVPAIVRLRRALKCLLRGFGLRAVVVEPADQEATANAT